MDYKEIQRGIQTKLDNLETLYFTSSGWNLIKLYKTKNPREKHLIRAIDHVKEGHDKKILVVGSAGLDYLIHLHFLTGKPVYGIELSSRMIDFQAKKIQAIHKSKNYDELQEKLCLYYGELDEIFKGIVGGDEIRNFKEADLFGNVTDWMLFEDLQKCLDYIHPMRADAHTQPFPDGTFDFIFFDCPVDYSPYPVEFFKECLRSLKKGGHLFMNTFCFHEGHEGKSKEYKQIWKEAKKASSEINTVERTLHLIKSSN